jgi:hypothetical protein
MKKLLIALALTLLLLPAAVATGSSSRTSRSSSRSTAKKSGAPKSTSRTDRSQTRSSKCATCKRDARGRIARSTTAKHEFQKAHPCPSTGKTTGACKGYVIDHITPLKRGGTDTPGNMQWQTTAAAKAKDKVE